MSKDATRGEISGTLMLFGNTSSFRSLDRGAAKVKEGCGAPNSTGFARMKRKRSGEMSSRYSPSSFSGTSRGLSQR